MQRKIHAKLEQWRTSPYRKPLVLQGARQVGKTYAILAFGREQYENVAYFNFESDPILCQTFDERIHPDTLLPILSHISKQSIVKEKTLLVFDEIQACERALTALKYFAEEAPEYHIIAAGSLLGVAVHREKYSFPVGKVDLMTLYPMDMEEYLLALGEDALVQNIRQSFQTHQPMPAALHQQAMELYRKYLVVGGMPECVAQYVQTKDMILIRSTQKNILQSYLHDTSKYSTESNTRKVRQTYDSITVQLSRKNTRFQYKLLKKGGRAAEFEDAIQWLLLSGILHRVYRAEQIKKPLENYRDIDSFKIYMADVGLLCAKKDVLPEDVLYMSADLDDFKGGLTENYVHNHLIANAYPAYYWNSDRGAEVDFIIQRAGDLVPLEVKSADNTRAKSLGVYMDTFQPNYAMKLSGKNFGYEGRIITVPLYAAFCL